MARKKEVYDLTLAPETVTIEQAAGYLGLHPHTVRQAIKAGQFSARQIGKRRYILRDELLKFLGK